MAPAGGQRKVNGGGVRARFTSGVDPGLSLFQRPEGVPIVTRFVVPAAASVLVGLLLGAASVFGVTLMIQQDTKPPLSPGDPASSVLNRVEYGNRG